MNPLTLVKRIKEINSKEAALGISEGASWHVKYKESPYVYVGGLPFDLTEGDLLAIFSQYGEIVDVNLVRHKATGKSRGFAFVAYEDQRSTNLAVDNLNGASVLGRIIRVDHVSDYKKKEEEDEEMEQQKREARGVCRAFQRGDCTRGATCKFSHDEQRCADTGWGAKDDGPKWKHDKHEIPPVKSGRTANFSAHIPESRDQEEAFNIRPGDKGNRLSRAHDDDEGRKNYSKRSEINLDMRGKRSEKSGKEPNHRDWDRQAAENTSGKYESERKSKEDLERRSKEDRSLRHASERNPRNDPDRKEKSGRHNSEPNHRDWDRQATENTSGKYELEPKSKEDSERRRKEDRSLRHASERNPRDDPDRKEKSGRHNSELNPGEDCDRKRREGSTGWRDYERTQRDQRGGDKRSRHDGDSSSRHHREEDEGLARRR